MRATRVVPTGVERRFEPTEIIVSKTDARGIITYVNDVFIRVSDYPESELVGRPHNVIRHPDMPRSVFGLLWETIAAGDEMFAYIVNLARDGGHYWVLAHVTPTFDAAGTITGYHSNRRVPDRAVVSEISALYAELLAAEAEHQHPRAAIEAGRSRLAATLADRRQTYEEFVWGLTNSLGNNNPKVLV